MYKIYTAKIRRMASCVPFKLLLIMKLAFVLTIATFLQVSAATYAQKISINKKDASLKEIFDVIEQQTSFTVVYSSKMVKASRPVSIFLTDATLEDVLNRCLKDQKLAYSISMNTIVIRKETDAPKLVQLLVKVSGKITDANHAPLPGVTIQVKGTSIGTVSDTNGNYTISAPDQNSILVFSYIGFETQQRQVGNNTTIDIVLNDKPSKLDEVVVVGYGTEKKGLVTASVSTLKGDEIANAPVANLSNALTGRVSGVIITQGGGEPGYDGADIHIRGIATTGNSSPLIVVDGIYRDFAHLDPNSIESFTVLKDAAAVAPYGLAGANGVILITTKKGKTGAPTLSYNSYVGIQNPTRMTKMVNSYQYALMQNEAAFNENSAGIPYSAADLQGYLKTANKMPGFDMDKYPSSNGLRDLILKNRVLTNHNLELSGGTESIKYYTALGYTYQQGQWSTTSLDRYNLLAKIDAKATKTTNVIVSVNGWLEDHHYPGRSAGAIMYQAFRNPPVYAIKYSNGSYGGYQNRSLLGEVYDTGYSEEENTQLYTSLTIEQQLPFIKGLSIKGVASYDPYTNYEKNWELPATYYSVNTSTTPYTFSPATDGQSKPLLIIRNGLNKAFTYQGYLNYHNSFGKNSISFLGVAEYRNQKNRSQYDERDNYNLDIDELDAGSALSTDVKNGGSSSEAKQVGYVYRANYSYAGKYVVEAVGRYDGHYYFAPGHRYGFFPTFGLSWNASEESFIRNNYPWVDALKLRTSYGQSGNLAGGSFQYLSSYGLGGGAVFTTNGTPTATQGVYESSQPNPNITWERQTQFDIGVEGSLWKGNLTFEVDYFHQQRNNMLVTRQITAPSEYGIGLSQENYGIMSNQGFDLTLGTQQHLSNGMNWGVTAIISYAKSKLIRVDELAASYSNPNTRQTGRPLGTTFGYKALGFFQQGDFNPDGSLKAGIPTQPWGTVHPGDIRYADLNGDGKITTDNKDQTVIGHPGTPQMQFSLSPNFSYKGFDINLLFQGATMSNIQIGGTIAYPFDIASSATVLQFEDHWTPANTNARYPRLTSAPVPNNQQFSSFFERNNTYVRLKNAQLGYTLSPKLTKHIGIQSVRFYLSAQNLWTWTPYIKEVIDPEAGSTNGQYYFQQQVVSLGTNITF